MSPPHPAEHRQQWRGFHQRRGPGLGKEGNPTSADDAFAFISFSSQSGKLSKFVSFPCLPVSVIVTLEFLSPNCKSFCLKESLCLKWLLIVSALDPSCLFSFCSKMHDLVSDSVTVEDSGGAHAST